ncbi:hypothetical protein HN695_05620 [Candidatus Woesearchaeota archaeon]|jgi:hypothetical protein|nr:hypothetical protein [archaeon]MBT4858917.1 hypothetical protein [archaeon]MBT7927792.1 hypothetical protein [Candidatus Woesearchaeota archaeon]
MSWSHGVKNFRTFTYNFSKFGLTFTPEEIKGMITTVLISAFVYSFDQWGGEKFNFITGIFNFIIAIIFISIALFIMQLGQRLAAVYYGYDPVYEHGMLGLLIALVIAFASRGSLVMFMPGYTAINHLMASRLGEFRYYTSHIEQAKINFIGIFFNFMTALIASLLPYKDIPIIDKFLKINMMFALYALIPFPQNPGFYIFFTHKNIWAFCVGFIVGGSILMLLTNVLVTLIGATLLGIMTVAWWFFKKDKMQGQEGITSIRH